MTQSLVIVESPAKGKTIERYLGPGYQVMASYGHVRDLIPKEGAVDPDNDFAMRYQIIERNQKHVDAILKALAKSDRLLLATDPDREGEAISWHLVELLQELGALDGKEVERVVFHEITKRAIQDAVANPRQVSIDMVNAQQARRALDYLVGFKLSPLLWRKIKGGLSAGRVQSPALRMICEREDEIDKFIPQEYWTVLGQTAKNKQAIAAKLWTLNGEKVKQFTLTNAEQADAAKAAIELSAQGELTVAKVEKKQRKRNPSAPFTTSTLQQEGVRKIGFSAQKTMRTAQGLYEGIDIGGETVGLITYMRTDSVTLSQDAIEDIRSLIVERYGKDNLPAEPNTYKSKAKNAQEAHEAIRPTSASRTPESVKQYLNAEQFKLYDLIWKRTIACQMIHATLDQVAVDLSAGDDHSFRANGQTIRHPGFMAVYQESEDDKKADDNDRTLPVMVEGEKLPLSEVKLDQHFTEPPPRYTEASLVKALEEYGIGRPSTYASIISTLQGRDYVELESRRFTPTDIGRVVNRFLSNHFEQYVDYDFTAKLEDALDDVSRGEREWIPLMDDFWKPFIERVEDKMESVSRAEAVQARQLGIDPDSGRPISARIGRFGAIVQIGNAEDEEKPRFQGLRPGQKIDTITLEEALVLFQLPRDLGVSPAEERVSTNIGRFGPYVKYDFYPEGAKKLTTKYVSIRKDDGDDPYDITLERALELIARKKEEDANKFIKQFDGTEIQILNGRWGPYITDGNKNAKIPKDLKEKPLEITQEQAEQWLSEAPEKRGKKKAAAKKTAAKKTTAKKTAAKKTTAKKTATKKTASKKKTTAKKATAKKTTTKKTASKVKAASKAENPDDPPF